MRDSGDGLVEWVGCYNRLQGPTGNSLKPKWGRIGYLRRKYKGWFRVLFSSQGSIVYSTWVYGLSCLCG